MQPVRGGGREERGYVSVSGLQIGTEGEREYREKCSEKGTGEAGKKRARFIVRDFADERVVRRV